MVFQLVKDESKDAGSGLIFITIENETAVKLKYLNGGRAGVNIKRFIRIELIS
jgi:hypothetical protein